MRFIRMTMGRGSGELNPFRVDNRMRRGHEFVNINMHVNKTYHFIYRRQ